MEKIGADNLVFVFHAFSTDNTSAPTGGHLQTTTSPCSPTESQYDRTKWSITTIRTLFQSPHKEWIAPNGPSPRHELSSSLQNTFVGRTAISGRSTCRPPEITDASENRDLLFLHGPGGVSTRTHALLDRAVRSD